MSNNKKDTAFRSYWRHILPHKYKFLFVGISFTFSEILLALVPVFIGLLIDALTSQNMSSVIWLYVAYLIGFNSVHDITWRLSEMSYRSFILPHIFSYENTLFKRILGQPYHYFVDNASGKIASYIQLLRNEFGGLLFSSFYKYIGMIVSIVTSLAILGSINLTTAYIYLGGIACMLIVGRYTLRQDMKYQAKEADIHASKNSVLFDSLSNFATIKTLGIEPQEVSRFKKSQTKALKISITSFNWGLIFWTSMAFFVRHIIWPLIIVVNVLMFMSGDITVGQLTTILSVILIFSNNIWTGIWLVSEFGNTKARIDEAYGYLQSSYPQLPARTVRPFAHAIRLDDVSFAYPDAPTKNTLNHLSLTIRKGQHIGIVGKSGSGKSTLAKLLLGLYDIDKKHCTLDDKPTNLQDVSTLISFVPQDTSLFSRSVAENIRYGNPDATDEEIIEACKKAHAWEFVKALPKGIDTVVGERGVKLSGGQRQRISIARAILHNQPILLLDEATSALDSESEIAIQKAIDTLAKDKTIIAIAHRLSTLQKMDRIIVMDGGAIIEDGAHNELIKAGGTYATLWKHQSGGFL